MNWDAIGAIGEIVGALAVFITLVYLSVQIRHSTKATRLQTAQATFHLSFEEVALFTQGRNPEIWCRFRVEGWKALPPSDQVVAGALAITLFTTYDSHYQNYREGTLSLEIHNSYRTRLIRQLSVPAIREWWAHNEVQFTESFKIYVNNLVSKKKDDM